ncbi:MAG: 30S ribosomal protein S17 [candidate division WOR-3 bacterium]
MAGSRKILVGIVKSNKMEKTVVVECERLVQHPKYKKYIKKKTRLYAHDEKNECQIGDRVMIKETRPLSKLKRWRVVKKL